MLIVPFENNSLCPSSVMKNDRGMISQVQSRDLSLKLLLYGAPRVFRSMDCRFRKSITTSAMLYFVDSNINKFAENLEIISLWNLEN